jgi:hypothetical protein
MGPQTADGDRQRLCLCTPSDIPGLMDSSTLVSCDWDELGTQD